MSNFLVSVLVKSGDGERLAAAVSGAVERFASQDKVTCRLEALDDLDALEVFHRAAPADVSIREVRVRVS
jgi:hypothetical protein